MSKRRHSEGEESRSNERLNSKPNKKKTEAEDLEEHGFKIGRKLGEGSYSKVRLAFYEDKEIAVKVICRKNLSDDFKRKFLPRELEILNRAHHKYIIKVFSIFNYPENVYIFMELIERGDLLTYIRDRGNLPEAEIRRYFSQMVEAMRYLHENNYAHRDIKCENIMLDNHDTIRIIDFGFCRNTVRPDGRRELSETFCGSTAYAAPEVLQGRPYNPMLYDIWSLGCVLFIMATGTMPFDDTSGVGRLVKTQLRRGYEYPDDVHVTNSLKDLIRTMLEPDVTRRANISRVKQHPWMGKDEDSDSSSDDEGKKIYTKEAKSDDTDTMTQDIKKSKSKTKGKK